MKVLIRLLKNDFTRIFRINQMRYGNPSQRSKAISLYILIFAVVIGIIIYWMNSLHTVFSYAWTSEEVIAYFFGPMLKVSVVLNLFIGIFWGSGLLLSDKNVEAKLALPIPMLYISLSKLSILYILQLFLNSFLLFPMVHLYRIAAETSPLYYFAMAVVVLLLPVIPSLLGTIIGTGIYYIMHKPSILLARLKTVAAVIILFTYLTYIFLHFSAAPEDSTTTLFSLFSGEGPLDKAIQSIVSLQGFAFVLYLSGVLLLGYLMACLIGRIFRHWYCDLSHDTKSVSLQGAYSFAQKGIIGALIARERHRYFSIPVYVINTALGYMMAAIFVIFAVVIKEGVAAQIYQFGGLFQIPYSSGEMLYVYALAIMVSLSCTTFPSISIEGKNMELIKSMPISIFEFIKAKLLFHLSLSIPITLVLNTALAFGLHLQWAAILSGYLLPLVFSAFIGVAGCIANLLFPSFDWENATYIVKRSIPAILNALMSMALSCGEFYILIKHFPKHLFIGNAVIILIVVGLTAAAILWLKEKGEILYRKL